MSFEKSNREQPVQYIANQPPVYNTSYAVVTGQTNPETKFPGKLLWQNSVLVITCNNYASGACIEVPPVISSEQLVEKISLNNI